MHAEVVVKKHNTRIIIKTTPFATESLVAKSWIKKRSKCASLEFRHESPEMLYADAEVVVEACRRWLGRAKEVVQVCVGCCGEREVVCGDERGKYMGGL